MGAAAALLLVVLTVSALAGGGPDEPLEPASSGNEPVRVREADYVGLPVDEARARLRGADLRVEAVRAANPGDAVPGRVAEVEPTGLVEPDTLVTLTVWGPVPDVYSEDDEDDDGDDGDEDEPKPDKPGEGKAKGKQKGKQ